MTIRMYADRKGLPLHRTTVRLRHDRTHAHDCDACGTAAPALEKITRTITLDGDLTDAQRARLLEIADRCPVHRTLGAPLTVVTRPGDAEG